MLSANKDNTYGTMTTAAALTSHTHTTKQVYYIYLSVVYVVVGVCVANHKQTLPNSQFERTAVAAFSLPLIPATIRRLLEFLTMAI